MIKALTEIKQIVKWSGMSIPSKLPNYLSSALLCASFSPKVKVSPCSHSLGACTLTWYDTELPGVNRRKVEVSFYDSDSDARLKQYRIEDSFEIFIDDIKFPHNVSNSGSSYVLQEILKDIGVSMSELYSDSRHGYKTPNSYELMSIDSSPFTSPVFMVPDCYWGTSLSYMYFKDAITDDMLMSTARIKQYLDVPACVTLAVSNPKCDDAYISFLFSVHIYTSESADDFRVQDYEIRISKDAFSIYIDNAEVLHTTNIKDVIAFIKKTGLRDLNFYYQNQFNPESLMPKGNECNHSSQDNSEWLFNSIMNLYTPLSNFKPECGKCCLTLHSSLLKDTVDKVVNTQKVVKEAPAVKDTRSFAEKLNALIDGDTSEEKTSIFK